MPHHGQKLFFVIFHMVTRARNGTWKLFEIVPMSNFFLVHWVMKFTEVLRYVPSIRPEMPTGESQNHGVHLPPYHYGRTYFIWVVRFSHSVSLERSCDYISDLRSPNKKIVDMHFVIVHGLTPHAKFQSLR